MSDDTSAQSDVAGQEDETKPRPLQVALGLFILPLLVVVGAVSIFLLFGAIAHEDKSASQYLAEVRGGGINEPWQGAFGLANILAQDDGLRGDARLAAEIINTLEHRNAQRDPQTRKFLVLALGRVGHPSALPVLAERLGDENADVRLYTLWSIGDIGAPEAKSVAPAVAGLLRDDDVSVRSYAAYVLGTLENAAVQKALAVALNDPASHVRGNAAVALARLGDDSGLGELHKILDRDYLDGMAELNAQQQQDAMVAAIQALALIGRHTDRARLIDLRDNDPDLRVQEAARVALASLESTTQS